MADRTYLENLKKMQEIRELAGRELNLPQICVVGDQSSGKSSLLEAITGIKFPVKGGICTKAPIVVECTRNEDLPTTIYEVFSPQENSYVKCPLQKLAQIITKIQKAALSGKKGITIKRSSIRIIKTASSKSSLVDNPYDEEVVDESDSSDNGEPADGEGTDLEDTDDSIRQYKNNKCNEPAVISEEEIRVRATGPKQIDVVVIDLPGIINRNVGKKETRRLICNYIEPAQTLILLVSVCAQDEQLASAIDLAKRFDPLGLRTLRILTKFDHLTNESTSSIESTLQLIRGVENDISDEKSNGELKKQTFHTSTYQQSTALLPHAVACRIKASDDYDETEENKILEKYNLPAERSGIPALRKRLPPIYAALIRTNLSGLKESIYDKLENARYQLKRIGEKPVESLAMIMECRRVLVDEMDEFKIELSVPHKKLADRVHATRGNITESWTKKKLMPNAYDCPFFQGNSAFLTCLKEIVEWWEPIAEDYQKDIKKIVEDSLKDLRSKAFGVSKTLINCVEMEWRRYCLELFKTFGEKINDTLLTEMDFGTDNHYLNAKYYEEQLLPKGMVDEIIETIAKSCNQSQDKPMTTEDFQAKITNELEMIRENWALQFQAHTLHEQQQKRLYAAVVAVWSVKKKSFTDNVLRCTRDFVLKARREWIEVNMLLGGNIKKHAKEDGHIKEKREMLKKKIKRLSQCKDVLAIF